MITYASCSQLESDALGLNRNRRRSHNRSHNKSCRGRSTNLTILSQPVISRRSWCRGSHILLSRLGGWGTFEPLSCLVMGGVGPGGLDVVVGPPPPDRSSSPPAVKLSTGKQLSVSGPISDRRRKWENVLLGLDSGRKEDEPRYSKLHFDRPFRIE